MRYQGGKGRLAKYLAPVILAAKRSPDDRYIEPFLGGAYTFAAIAPHFGKAEAGDVMPDLVMFWSAVRDGWQPPDYLTREEYAALRHAEPSALRAFAGFGCSFGGKWFGGYGTQRVDARHPVDHVSYGSAITTARKRPALAGASIYLRSYEEWNLGMGDVVYCDPPYAETTEYKGIDAWNPRRFWAKAEAWSTAGARVFISEYAAPEGWRTVWSRDTRSSMSRGDNVSVVTEHLFTM